MKRTTFPTLSLKQHLKAAGIALAVTGACLFVFLYPFWIWHPIGIGGGSIGIRI